VGTAALPVLGAAVRDLWPLDPGVVYLNHGGFGVTPHEVASVAAEWRARIERNPMRFMVRDYPAEVRKAAAELATFLGAASDRVVFVENATAGLNAVLRSRDFAAGDEIVIPSLAYGASMKATRYVAARTGAVLVTPDIPVPLADAEAAAAAVIAALSSRTRLVIVDHIVSAMGFVLPVRTIADAAHAHGARVLIDGAHAPGQIPLAVADTGADWYVGNLHKWLFAPRACGVLWVREGAEAGLHPLAISHGYGQGLAAEFDWTGTHDPAAILSVPAAIAFHRRLGGAALMARNAALAAEAAALVSERFGTPMSGAPSLFASMATVALPARFGTTDGDAARLRQRLSDIHRIETVLTVHDGRLWVRLAAQAYNERGAYERLGALLAGM
jgi:isopenicillin-N epimerase